MNENSQNENNKSDIVKTEEESGFVSSLESQETEAQECEESDSEAMQNSTETSATEEAPEAKPKRKHSSLGILCNTLCVISICACVVLCCAMLAGSFDLRTSVVYQNENWVNPGSEDTENAIVNAAAKASASVVAITTERVSYTALGNYVSAGAGSGVICTEDGYIITNHHVISGATNIIVTLENGDSFQASLVGSDSQTDLAVIKIPAKGLKPAVYADPDSVMVGQTVIAIGNPLGNLSNTVTNGIVSSLARQVKISGAKMTLLQHNAAVSPGNSGGGLFNVNGELIGIVNAKSAGDGIEGIGFAIPIQTFKTIVAQLMENQHVSGRVQLGITAHEILSAQKAYSVPNYIRSAYEKIGRMGVYISGDSNVQYKKDSDQLQRGDYLASIDDQLIDEFDDLSLYLAEKSIGDTVKLTVYRYDNEAKKTTQLTVYIILTEKT